jgi:Flp pilus assembly protein TadD
MKPTNYGKCSKQIAAALGAMLLTASCTAANFQPRPTQAGLPKSMDRGVGQLMSYCQRLRDSGDLVKAAGMCERAHRLAPDNPEPLMMLAEILREMGQPQQAVRAYQALLSTHPEHADARYALAKTYISFEQFDLALVELEAALQTRPDDPRIYNALGIANGLLGDHPAAQDTFRAGLSVAPSDVPLRNNLGLSLALAGQYEESLAILGDVAADPNANETSMENLQLARGLATAAETEAMLARIEAANAWLAESELPHEDVLAIAARNDNDDSPRNDPYNAQIQLGLPPSSSDPEEDQAAAASEPIELAGIATNDRSSARYPTIVQTAKAGSSDVADGGPPISVMGDYMPADVNIGEVPEARADEGEETQVAALPDETGFGPRFAEAGEYTVQFASYTSEERAGRGWSELQARAEDLIGNLDPVVRSADLGDKGTFYRLRTKTTGKDAAYALCDAMKTRGFDCLVVKDAEQAADERTAAKL